MRTWIGSLMLGTLVVMTAVSRPARRDPAQDYLETSAAAGTVTMSTTTLDSIVKRLEALEAKADDQKKGEKKEDEWKDVSAEKWTVKFGGRAMADYVTFADQDAGNQARFGDIDNYIGMATGPPAVRRRGLRRLFLPGPARIRTGRGRGSG